MTAVTKPIRATMVVDVFMLDAGIKVDFELS